MRTHFIVNMHKGLTKVYIEEISNTELRIIVRKFKDILKK